MPRVEPVLDVGSQPIRIYMRPVPWLCSDFWGIGLGVGGLDAFGVLDVGFCAFRWDGGGAEDGRLRLRAQWES